MTCYQNTLWGWPPLNRYGADWLIDWLIWREKAGQSLSFQGPFVLVQVFPFALLIFILRLLLGYTRAEGGVMFDLCRRHTYSTPQIKHYLSLGPHNSGSKRPTPTIEKESCTMSIISSWFHDYLVWWWWLSLPDRPRLAKCGCKVRLELLEKAGHLQSWGKFWSPGEHWLRGRFSLSSMPTARWDDWSCVAPLYFNSGEAIVLIKNIDNQPWQLRFPFFHCQSR